MSEAPDLMLLATPRNVLDLHLRYRGRVARPAIVAYSLNTSEELSEERLIKWAMRDLAPPETPLLDWLSDPMYIALRFDEGTALLARNTARPT